MKHKPTGRSIFSLILMYSLCLVLLSCAQRTMVEQTNNSKQTLALHDTIPFTLTEHDNIIIQALINDIDTVDLMFHTGAHFVSLTREALKSTNSIRFTDSTEVESWGGGGESKYSDHNTLSIKDLHFDSLRIWSSERSGHYSDGKVGPTVLKSQIFGLIYSENILVLYSDLPDGLIRSGYFKIPIISDDGSLYVNAQSIVNHDTMSQNFLIHTGYSGTLLFDDDFVNENSLGSSMEIISESELNDSYGNKVKTKKAMLPTLIISDYTISELPIGFFEGSIGRQKRSVMGSELLKRFDLVFDIRNEELYLKKSKYFDQGFPGLG